MMTRASLLAIAATALASQPRPAAADRLGAFVEATAGLSSPTSDDRYNKLFKSGTKLGIHAGPLLLLHRFPPEVEGTLQVGLEIGVDETHLALQDGGEGYPEVTRSRFTVGPRVVLRFQHAMLFARAGAGRERMKIDNSSFLEALCGDPTIRSLAYEGGAGIGVALGPLVLGVQVGIGVSNHRDDRPACLPLNGQEIHIDVFDTRNVDHDVAVSIGGTL